MDKTHTQHRRNSGQPAVYPQFLKTGVAPISTKVERTPDPRETAQEAVHQVMPKDAITRPGKPASSKDAAPPLRAAKGDDDVMSQQRKSS